MVSAHSCAGGAAFLAGAGGGGAGRVHFETAPSEQIQIDFGERLVEIAGAKLRAYLVVATLGYRSAFFTLRLPRTGCGADVPVSIQIIVMAATLQRAIRRVTGGPL